MFDSCVFSERFVLHERRKRSETREGSADLIWTLDCMSLASMMLYAVIVSLVGWRKELVKGLFLLGGLARDQGQPGHALPGP